LVVGGGGGGACCTDCTLIWLCIQSQVTGRSVMLHWCRIVETVSLIVMIEH
jgi:hypothetical protein